MKNFIKVCFINMISLFIVSTVFNDKFIITGFFALVVSSVIFTLINIYLKPVIKIITLPINFFTLGLFTLFINAFMLIIVEKLVPGVYIKDFSTAFFGAMLLSIIYICIHIFIIDRNEKFHKENLKKQKSDINAGDVIDVEGTYVYEDKNNDVIKEIRNKNK